MAHLLLSAAHKSSGKTTITLGICAALARRGLTVQAFKKGPDYIDPMWLAKASDRPCHNLDFYTQGREEILDTFVRQAYGTDISVIEGNKGLHDGMDLEGGNSSAALAKLLGAPVVLVVDTQGMTRGVAPLLLGFQAFDPDVRVAGVILNKVGGFRHEGKLRAAIERYTDIPVLGAVHRDPRLHIVERHLGLMPSNEAAEAQAVIDRIAERIGEQVDLERVLALAAEAKTPTLEHPIHAAAPPPPDLRLGIVRDAAFGFYYPDDLAALRAAGAELVEIDALHDQRLPDIDGLFIGGGFPEVHMEALQANRRLRADIFQAIDAGLPVYAECGGLMYLARSIRWKDRTCEMVGAIPADVVMHEGSIGRGYICLRETDAGPWPVDQASGRPTGICGHEFHYSSLENLDSGLHFAYEVLRGTGIINQRDGIVHKNVLATYAHQRDVTSNRWVRRFIGHIRQCRQHRPIQVKTAQN